MLIPQYLNISGITKLPEHGAAVAAGRVAISLDRPSTTNSTDIAAWQHIKWRSTV